ncbi:hypothetical protein Lal_00018659 [Lupinus albus]|uniref:Uncharacterized protein n=1 Tax=Lupinus albus TaxID=3870 RepID=A0A6A5M7P2_LUPAL|nr:hypothetical protein Lalb_Chr12g0208001 [Lupinus albus]KAF1868143.1 hypothetical protein Lal_00018659 [Lupinus albus]
MSITYLIFFLCISLHACNARHLSTLDKKVHIKSHFSFKSEERSVFDSYPRKVNEGNYTTQTRLVDDSEKPKGDGNSIQKVVKAKGKASNAVKTESLVSVSMNVPHKNPIEENPEFSLDYSPPKTHPPHHN